MRLLMLTAVLCIATQSVVASPLTIDEWTAETQEAFHAFVVAFVENNDARRSAEREDEDARTSMDILDYAKTKREGTSRIDDAIWLDALRTLESQFYTRPQGYDTKETWEEGTQVFWEIGADTLIQLIYDGFNATKDEIGIASHGDLRNLAESAFEAWIDNPLDSYGIAARIFEFTYDIFPLVAYLKISQEWDGALSEFASTILDGFRSKLKTHPNESKWDVVSEPLVEKLIEILKYAEDHNELPPESE